MTNVRQIGISDFYVADSDYRLRTSGLGSCVGIIFYDKRSKIGGLSHVMLPESPKDKQNIDIKKYCDTNIPVFYQKLLEKGAQKMFLKAAIFGGSEMFPFLNNPLMNIGKRNIQSVETILKELGIPILFRDTGGSKGRTIELNIEKGEIQLRTAYEEEQYYTF